MGKHVWQCISPGEYDSTYECARCGKRFMEQADNPESVLPETGCITNKSPIERSLWSLAFFEIAEQAQRNGDSFVEFELVDEKVLAWSKMPIDQLLQMLSGCYGEDGD